jgi:hypothetical protein
MSVNTYLTSLATVLVLKGYEEDNINSSISTLKTRLGYYFFGSRMAEHFMFGSKTRGTILPRKADENSDIDYMIIFNTAGGTYKPQTYLNQIKQFAEKYYYRSEIRQSHPTVVLELNHIKFDLVPATYSSGYPWATLPYQIPSSASDWNDWMSTDPNGFNQKLTSANVAHNYEIKPLVRLIKYWNAINGKCFASFSLENYIVDYSFLNLSSLKPFFYNFWDNFSCGYGTSQYIVDRVQRAKECISRTRQYEQQGFDGLAENEIKKLLPPIE